MIKTFIGSLPVALRKSKDDRYEKQINANEVICFRQTDVQVLPSVSHRAGVARLVVGVEFTKNRIERARTLLEVEQESLARPGKFDIVRATQVLTYPQDVPEAEDVAEDLLYTLSRITLGNTKVTSGVSGTLSADGILPDILQNFVDFEFDESSEG